VGKNTVRIDFREKIFLFALHLPYQSVLIQKKDLIK
jgi:hypothetical protein